MATTAGNHLVHQRSGEQEGGSTRTTLNVSKRLTRRQTNNLTTNIRTTTTSDVPDIYGTTSLQELRTYATLGMRSTSMTWTSKHFLQK